MLDTFAKNTLRNLIRMASLRRANSVIGIHPDVAIATVRLGMHPDIAPTAIDLDDGITFLDEFTV